MANAENGPKMQEYVKMRVLPLSWLSQRLKIIVGPFQTSLNTFSASSINFSSGNLASPHNIVCIVRKATKHDTEVHVLVVDTRAHLQREPLPLFR